MIIIDGKKIQQEILSKIKNEVAALPFVPIFCDVLVGDEKSSVQYVKMKATTALSVGIKFHTSNFPSTINTEELIKEIKLLNEIPNMCGIIVQLPLPAQIDKQIILDAIDPRLDVDCLGSVTSKKFYNNENIIGFPTALACMNILDSIALDLKDKSVVVLGQGILVGKPVTALLEMRGIFPSVVDINTENKEEIIKNADIIISGIGDGKYIKGDMLKQGVILIDAGTSEENTGTGGIVGDVDQESVKDVASYLSPVPGGVGPVTVAMLLQNVLHVAKNIIKN